MSLEKPKAGYTLQVNPIILQQVEKSKGVRSGPALARAGSIFTGPHSAACAEIF